MLRSTKPCRLFVVFVLSFFLAPAAGAQDQLDEAQGQVRFRGRNVSLGQHRDEVVRSVGKPTSTQKGVVFYNQGATFHFGKGNRLQAIEVHSPFTGITRKRLKVGDSKKQVAFATGRRRPLRDGWNQAGKLYVLIKNDRVAKMRVGSPPNGFVPVQPLPPTKKPVKRPVKTPVKAPVDTPERPKNKRNPRNGNNRRPGNNRGPGNNLQPGNNAQQDRILVFESEWEAQRRLSWRNVPTDKWPHNQGHLLVRVALGQDISKCEQFFCGHELVTTRAGDSILDAGIVAAKRRRGRGLSWQWRFHGRGKGKVRIIWFRRLDDLRRYQISQPFASNFDYRRVARPWRNQVKLVWQETWDARNDGRLLEGPKESWPDDNGVLLVRAFGEPGIDGFVYRAGVRSPVELQLGDHTLPVDILDKARKRSLFGGLSRNNAHKRFHFGFRGRGRGKIMIYWLPEARYVDTYCAENTWNGANPWRNTRRRPNLLDWVFQGPQQWRSSSNFESDWRTPLSQISGTQTNVASRANGSLLRRSSRDRRLSRGSEFDGGIWQSRPGRFAFSESRFSGLTRINRIEIASAGSDFEAAHFITVELDRGDGTWDRVAAFHNENINWHRLSSNRNAVSRPGVSIPVDPRISYRGIRISFSGVGPFRLAGVRVIGTFVGDRIFDDLPDLVETARAVEVSATLGWTDTGGEVLPGHPVLIDIDGQWSVAPENDSRFGWSGPEGIAAALLQSIFTTAASRNDFQRRLPAPNLPAGALIGKLGLNGSPFLVTPGQQLLFDRRGRLFLGINDHALNDNRGSLICTVLGARFQQPPIVVPQRNVVEIVCTGRVFSRSLNRGISDVDVLAQLEARPRTIFGGERTDGQGRFSFTVLVPKGQPFVIASPEFKVESGSRTYIRDGQFLFDIELQ